MIAIIDYGMGNLHSVSKAVERLGYSAVITSDEEQILAADGAILPGVGAFPDAMQHLQDTGLKEVVLRYADTGKPLLGICLGMQLLFTRSEEHGVHEGLNLLPGEIIRFKGDYKIPHMGWNHLKFRRQNDPLFAGLEDGYVYFVHSFHAQCSDPSHVLASADYYQEVTAIVGSHPIYGMQFHPEKSGSLGMRLLSNFLSGTRKKGKVLRA